MDFLSRGEIRGRRIKNKEEIIILNELRLDRSLFNK